MSLKILPVVHSLIFLLSDVTRLITTNITKKTEIFSLKRFFGYLWNNDDNAEKNGKETQSLSHKGIKDLYNL